MKNCLLYCMIVVANSANAQITAAPALGLGALVNKKPVLETPFSFNAKIIPANFYTNNLGFFCKQELKMQAYTKVPFKFRLGSVQHCDWMEGKLNARPVSNY